MRRTPKSFMTFLLTSALALLLVSCGGMDDGTRCVDLTAKLQSCAPGEHIPSTAVCSQGALDNYEQIMEMPCQALTEVNGKADTDWSWDWKMPWSECEAPCMLKGSWVHCTPNQFQGAPDQLRRVKQCCMTNEMYRTAAPFCQNMGYDEFGSHNSIDPSCHGNPQICQKISPELHCQWVSELSDMRCRSGYTNTQGHDIPCEDNAAICYQYGMTCQDVGMVWSKMRCRPGEGQHQPAMNDNLCATYGTMATCVNNYALNCEGGQMKREFCSGACRVQQRSTYFGYKKRAVCDNVHGGFGGHEGFGESPGGLWLGSEIGPGYSDSSPGHGSDPDCEWKAIVCKQFPGTMCTLVDVGPPPSYSKWPQTGWRCRNLDALGSGPSYPSSTYQTSLAPASSSLGISPPSRKKGVGEVCAYGGARYTCVDVTLQTFPNGTSNPCYGAQPGDRRIVVNKCPGDPTVRCCRLMPRGGFKGDDSIGGELPVDHAEGVAGCSLAATPGAGVPGLTLLLLLAGLALGSRRRI